MNDKKEKRPRLARYIAIGMLLKNTIDHLSFFL